MMTVDDLPWPELGNVSRGATRGNQGQKGVLGPPDRDGRCILQLRVQPGVLAVRLNRPTSKWYRILDSEVNHALKLTKTYWRKARRRQDYDARADQDHMELHEWLQQLKDKTMAHLELLMQKGDIQGPPYVMPDEIEISFLRKFIERHARGIPHNPRLRDSFGERPYPPRSYSASESYTSGSSEASFVDQNQRSLHDHLSDVSSPQFPTSSRFLDSLTLRNTDSLSHETSSSEEDVRSAQSALLRAQKDTQDAFMRYTACLDVEHQVRQNLAAAEKRRDGIIGVLLSQNQADIASRTRRSSITSDNHQRLSRYPTESIRSPTDTFNNARVNAKLLEWDTEVRSTYPDEPTTHFEGQSSRSRKHLCTWEESGPYVARHVGYSRSHASSEDQDYFEDMTASPPRKRLQVMSNNDVMNNSPIHTQNMGGQS